MEITFYGATREVTGSMFLLSSGTDNILLDCGMFQGHRKTSNEKNRTMPFDPSIVTNVILSHAHIDHSGRLPFLTKNGFNGRIISTRSTAAACGCLLPDSAHIQESDANYLKYKLVRSTLSEIRKSSKAKTLSSRKLEEIKKLLKKDRHELDTDTINMFIQKFHLEAAEPLYTISDADHALGYFDGYPYRHPVVVGKNITCKFYEAGHILGSAMSLIKVSTNGQDRNILYTGDIGRFNKPIIRDPCLNFSDDDKNIDLLVMESTYGNREHEPIEDLKHSLQKVLLETFESNGTVIIPAFAFGRTQTLIYILHELYRENKVPKVPVYIDSPLAIKLTRVFGEHPEVYDEDTHNTFLNKGINPFQFQQISFVSSVDESMAVNRQQGPQIVIAASGMCEAGRVLHHLRHKIHDPKNTILIVGYMAQHTLGRRIEEQGLAYEESGRKGPPPMMKFLQKEYPLKARVRKIGGLSAHADQKEMLLFLKQSNLKIKKIALVHGEEEQSLTFSEVLAKEGYDVSVPKLGETIRVT
jgi:metallo-beta-lactamase family protein